MPDGSHQRMGRSPGVSSRSSKESQSAMYVAPGSSNSREEREPEIGRDRKTLPNLRIERNSDAAHLMHVRERSTLENIRVLNPMLEVETRQSTRGMHEADRPTGSELVAAGTLAPRSSSPAKGANSSATDASGEPDGG